MKTLIISDLHLRHNIAEEIIDSVEHDQIVFLGDYFDNWHDTPIQNEEAAEWLKISLNEPNRIHLLGNHDHSYYDMKFACSGHTKDKSYVINKILKEEDWKKLKFYYVIDDWLFSHAGLTHPLYKTLCGKYHITSNLLTASLDKAVTLLDNDIKDFKENPNITHSLIGAGVSRGGYNRHGGITWCDVREFHPIPNVNQVFGHSIVENPLFITTFKGSLDKEFCDAFDVYNRIFTIKGIKKDISKVQSLNFAIDDCNRSYGILENNVFTTHEVRDLR